MRMMIAPLVVLAFAAIGHAEDKAAAKEELKAQIAA